ncbi:MAG: hypothetical protein ABEI27_08550 [Halobellus sp.]|uniref:hypothetical protein n=1 Tax=Halobellus sp. TaxID=1979212 RepID=UPI0035D4D789
MDALRLERTAWAVVFAAVVAVSATLLLLPDPTGAIAAGVALAIFAVVSYLAIRYALGSLPRDAVVGDQTVRYLVFFAVATVGRIGLGSVGLTGIVGTAGTLAVAWVLAMYAERLNPKRWGEGASGA